MFKKFGILVANLLLALVLVPVLVLVLLFVLGKYTHHGESITVPDLVGLTVPQLEDHLKGKNLYYVVMDSNYRSELPPYHILSQYPMPGEKVKEDRRIYLSVSTKYAPMVEMPDVRNMLLNDAKVQMESYGLEQGELEYRPDPVKNKVLEVYFEGEPIAAGSQIPKGSRLKMVLGNGVGLTSIMVPQMTGLTYREAKIALRALGLIEGVVVKQGNIMNLEEALVYAQSPDVGYDGKREITIGEPIDLHLRENPRTLERIVERKARAAEAAAEPRHGEGEADSLPAKEKATPQTENEVSKEPEKEKIPERDRGAVKFVPKPSGE